MNNWNVTLVQVKGFPVKIYTSSCGHHAVAFSCFGRYFSFRSDESALDLAVDILVNQNRSNVISLAAYKASLEDTAVINIAA